MIDLDALYKAAVLAKQTKALLETLNEKRPCRNLIRVNDVHGMTIAVPEAIVESMKHAAIVATKALLEDAQQDILNIIDTDEEDEEDEDDEEDF